jgi:hypothetical protein
MPSGVSVYERLQSLLRGAEGDTIRRLDRDMRAEGPSEINIILTSRSSRLIDVGGLITRTDRELRRAVNILDRERIDTDESYYFGAPSRRPRPIPASEGGLQVEDASAGSLHLLLMAYGLVLGLLTSRPLAALTSLITLGQGSGTVRFWSRRHRDPLDGMSARQLLNLMKELGIDPTAQMQSPSFEINTEPTLDESLLAQPEEEHPELAPTDYIPGAFISSGDFVVRGRRITYIREYPDGSRVVIQVDG